MNKRKIISTILTVCLLSCMISCNSKDSSIGKKNTLSEEQQIEIMNKVNGFTVDNEHTINELEKVISDNIGKVSDKDKENMIDSYLSALYTTVTDLQEKLSVLGYDIEDAIKNNKVDINNEKTYKNISDTNATVRGYLEELKAKGFTLKFSDESKFYFVTIDYQSVIDKYGKYLNESYKKLLSFIDYDNKNTTNLSDEKYTYNVDEIAKRIIMIEEGIKSSKENNYSCIDKWMTNLSSYYEMLLGINHSYFISTEYLNNDIYDKYVDIIDKNKDSQLAKVLKSCVSILDESNKKFDDTVRTKLEDTMNKEIYTDEINKALNNQ